mmetsp:Transcript_6360/g.21831  ORF Transcript_6360/g.21831 Transcript_6360/m.21831 type:complete len:213 (-) Transcript_6360:3098-3736(-)
MKLLCINRKMMRLHRTMYFFVCVSVSVCVRTFSCSELGDDRAGLDLPFEGRGDGEEVGLTTGSLPALLPQATPVTEAIPDALHHRALTLPLSLGTSSGAVHPVISPRDWVRALRSGGTAPSRALGAEVAPPGRPLPRSGRGLPVPAVAVSRQRCLRGVPVLPPSGGGRGGLSVPLRQSGLDPRHTRLPLPPAAVQRRRSYRPHKVLRMNLAD